MSQYFNKLDLPIYDLYDSLQQLINDDIVQFDALEDIRPMVRQICINTLPEYSDDYTLGRGSLMYDWDKSYIEVQEDGSKRTIVPKREVPLEESDFNTMCTQFIGTPFEDMYKMLDSKYYLGRVRIMKSDSKSCLSWHKDTSPRMHYPIKTQEGCFMVIEDEVVHMPANTWWLTDTTNNHTAFNASKEERIHIVACILGEK